MTLSELAPNDITRTALDAVHGQPMYVAFVALGTPNCPTCGERMNASAWAVWNDMVRNGWYCVNRKCNDAMLTRMRTTRIID